MKRYFKAVNLTPDLRKRLMCSLNFYVKIQRLGLVYVANTESNSCIELVSHDEEVIKKLIEDGFSFRKAKTTWRPLGNFTQNNFDQDDGNRYKYRIKRLNKKYYRSLVVLLSIHNHFEKSEVVFEKKEVQPKNTFIFETDDWGVIKRLSKLGYKIEKAFTLWRRA